MQVSKVKFIKNLFFNLNIRYIKILSFVKIHIQNNNSVKINQNSFVKFIYKIISLLKLSKNL
jgi:hypothetical protein